MEFQAGKLKTVVKAGKQKRQIRRFGNGGNDGNNGNNNGGDGGGDFRNNRENSQSFDETLDFRPQKLQVGMWFLLLIVVMTFGGLVGTYIVLANNKELEWRPFDLPWQTWFSTLIILAGSFTYEWANRNLQANRQITAKNYFVLTTVLGGIFIASQLFSWWQLVERGIYAQGNPYAGLFYILTAVHALHVLGGVLTLGYIVLLTQKETDFETELAKRQSISKFVGWYWHLMGGLWLVLFFLLGFWK